MIMIKEGNLSWRIKLLTVAAVLVVLQLLGQRVRERSIPTQLPSPRLQNSTMAKEMVKELKQLSSQEKTLVAPDGAFHMTSAPIVSHSGGEWVPANTTSFQWGSFSSLSSKESYRQCLRTERQGDCGDAWENSWLPQPEQYLLYNGTRANLRSCLGGVTIYLVGDSLTRQQTKALECLLNELVNGNVVLKYFRCPYLLDYEYDRRTGGPTNTETNQLCKPLERALSSNSPDLMLLNVGHWTDKAKLGLEWKEIFDVILRKTVARLETIFDTRPQPRIFFRMTASRFFREGDWNTSPEGWCGCQGPDKNRCRPDAIAQQPNPLAKYSDYNPLSLVLPAMNEIAKTIIQFSAVSLKIEILYTSEMSLAREDASYDCSHFCLPGVPDLWNLMLLERFCDQ